MTKRLLKTKLMTSLLGIALCVAPLNASARGRGYSSFEFGYGDSYERGYPRGHGHGYDFDRHRGYGSGWNRDHSRHHRHRGRTGDALLGLTIGMLAIGALMAAKGGGRGSSNDYARVAPPPPQRGGEGCHIVHRVGPDPQGYQVKFAGTMCYDRSGAPYIVPGSQRIIERY